MSFATPLCLLLLIPWLAVLFYLLLGKPPREPVPFLWLWRGPEAKRKVKPSLAKLPVWIALLMLAALAAIVGAAGPQRMSSDAPAAASQGKVGITYASIRGKQVMVRLLNESSRREASLALSWPGGGRTESLQVPQSGEQTYFVDLPANLASLRLILDQQTIDFIRQRTWPRVEARMPLPESLRRMLATYARNRPSDDDSRTIAIAPDVATLGGEAGVILADVKTSGSGKVSVTDHAVTRNVDWNALLTEHELNLAGAKTPPGFSPLVSVGESPVIAVGDSPRQVWVGFDTPTFPTRVDYVVFWTNVLDYAGEGSDDWKPAPGSQFVTPHNSQFVQKPVQNLTPWLILSAVSLLVIGLLTGRRRGQLR